MKPMEGQELVFLYFHRLNIMNLIRIWCGTYEMLTYGRRLGC